MHCELINQIEKGSGIAKMITGDKIKESYVEAGFNIIVFKF